MVSKRSTIIVKRLYGSRKIKKVSVRKFTTHIHLQCLELRHCFHINYLVAKAKKKI